MKKYKQKTAVVNTKRLTAAEISEGCGVWTVMLKGTETVIGSVETSKLSFIEKTAELKYEILPEYRGEGYAAEIISAVTDRVFGDGEIYFMRITLGREEKAREEMLSACGFSPLNADDETAEYAIYEKEKEKTAFMSIYMLLGMSVGMSVGVAVDKMAVGMCIGMSAGMALGLLLDRMDQNARKR